MPNHEDEYSHSEKNKKEKGKKEREKFSSSPKLQSRCLFRFGIVTDECCILAPLTNIQ